MLVCPSLCAYAGPKFRLFRANHAHTDVTAVLNGGLLDTPIQDAADFDRSVIAGAQQVDRSNPRERTHFMKRRRATVEEEPLQRLQRGRTYLLEDPQAEGLRDRRVNAIEHRIRPRILHPFRA